MSRTWTRERRGPLDVLRDPQVLARLVTFPIGLSWSYLGPGTVTLELIPLASAVMLLSTFLVVRRSHERGPLTVEGVPAAAVLLDLATTALWTLANTAVLTSFAFTVVIIAGIGAIGRLGRLGVALTWTAYVLGRGGAELVRRMDARPTELTFLLGEATIVAFAVLALAATFGALRAERQRTERARALTQTLESFAFEIVAETRVDAVLGAVVRAATELAGGDYAAVQVRRGGEFVLVAGAGAGQALVGLPAALDTGLAAEVRRRRDSLVSSDPAAIAALLPATPVLDLHALVAVPIVEAGEVVACISVGRRTPRPFDGDVVLHVEGLAAHAAVALRTARLLAAGQRALALALDPVTGGPLAARIVDEVAAACRVRHVALCVPVGAAHRLVAAKGALAAEAPEAVRRLLADATRAATPRMVADLAVAESAQVPGLHAALVVPGARGGDVRAALVVVSDEPLRVFDQIDRDLVVAFASVAAARPLIEPDPAQVN